MSRGVEVLEEPSEPTDGRLFKVRTVGLSLLVVGAVLLGYVCWQVFGTTWVSQRRQAQVVRELEAAWQQDARADQAHLVRVSEGEASAIVRIPRFGDDYEIPVLEGTGDEVLAAGFGHFTGSSEAGEVGNYAIAGHRVTHGEPLRRMPELAPGDEILVETPTMMFTYVLDTGGADLEVDDGEDWVLEPAPHDPRGRLDQRFQPGQRLITLVTCSELFHTDDRLVAFGHLKAQQRND